MEVDATTRYTLLKKALDNGYAHAKSHNVPKAHEIVIEREENMITDITFKLHGKAITSFTAESGIIDDHGFYTSFFDHLDYNIITNILKNATALEMAHENKLLKGCAKPKRHFEDLAKSMRAMQDTEPDNSTPDTPTTHRKILATIEEIHKFMPDGFTVEKEATIEPDIWGKDQWWGVVIVQKNKRQVLSKSDIEPVRIALKKATGFDYAVDDISNFVYHYAGPKCADHHTKKLSQPDPDSDDWTIVDIPTKVKHKKGSDGKPLITIPVRRKFVEKSGIETDSWIIFSFKEVPEPSKTTRKGGEGPKCHAHNT